MEEVYNISTKKTNIKPFLYSAFANYRAGQQNLIFTTPEEFENFQKNEIQKIRNIATNLNTIATIFFMGKNQNLNEINEYIQKNYQAIKQYAELIQEILKKVVIK